MKAWDLPTRLFKWSLVSLILTAWVSSSFADPDMTVHKAAGYGVLTLLIYRVLWGVFGGSTARFTSFVRSPLAVLSYLRAIQAKTAKPYLGHNPAGGMMILGLLIACGVQVLLGLFASDGVTASGPFADQVGGTVSAWAGTMHAVWFYVILSLAIVHIGVNFYYQFIKRENLIGAMLTGRKRQAAFADACETREVSPLVALACLFASVGLVYSAVTLCGGSFFAGL